MKHDRSVNPMMMALVAALLLTALGFGCRPAGDSKQAKNHPAGRIVKRWSGTYLEVDPSIRVEANLTSPKSYQNHDQALDSLNPVERETVTLLAPPDIIHPGFFDEITNAFPINVRLITYANDSALPELIRHESVDLALVRTYHVSWLIEASLLSTLNTDDLRTVQDTIWTPPVGKRFKSDLPEEFLTYSAPYLWSAVGIAFNRRYMPAGATNWADLLVPDHFDDKFREQIKGKVMMLGDFRDNYASALIYLGQSPNTKDSNMIARAATLLQRQRPYLAGRASFTQLRKSLADETVWIAQAMSADAVAAGRLNPNIQFVIPQPGTHVPLFSLVLPLHSLNKASGKALLQHLLDPKVEGHVSDYSKLASPNYRAQPYVDADLVAGPAYALPRTGQHALLLYVPPTLYPVLGSTP